MGYIRKTVDTYHIEGNYYGCGFELVFICETYKSGIEMIKCYRQNEGKYASFRMKKVREKKSDLYN